MARLGSSATDQFVPALAGRRARRARQGGQRHPHPDAVLARPGQGDRRRHGDLPGRRLRRCWPRTKASRLCAVPERIRHRGVRLEIPAGLRRLPASGDAARRRPRGAAGARPGRRMEAGPQAHRHHGLFRRRPPRLHAADPFRRGQTGRRRPDRAAKLPPGPGHPLLRGHHAWANSRTRERRTICWAKTPRPNWFASCRTNSR